MSDWASWVSQIKKTPAKKLFVESSEATSNNMERTYANPLQPNRTRREDQRETLVSGNIPYYKNGNARFAGETARNIRNTASGRMKESYNTIYGMSLESVPENLKADYAVEDMASALQRRLSRLQSVKSSDIRDRSTKINKLEALADSMNSKANYLLFSKGVSPDDTKLGAIYKAAFAGLDESNSTTYANIGVTSGKVMKRRLSTMSAKTSKKFLISKANDGGDQHKSHIREVKYQLEEKIMEVTFERAAKEGSCGNIAVFFGVPFNVAYEICMALEKNLKWTRYNKMRAAKDGAKAVGDRHLAGILFWSYVRNRGFNYGANYLYASFNEEVAPVTGEDGKEYGAIPTTGTDGSVSNVTNETSSSSELGDFWENFDVEKSGWKNKVAYRGSSTGSKDDFLESVESSLVFLSNVLGDMDIEAAKEQKEILDDMFAVHSNISFDEFLKKNGWEIHYDLDY